MNSNNQLSGSPYQYDAAGNMIHDASHAYFYDAENRLIQVDGTLGTCSTATACYNYDAFGRRVRKAGANVPLTTDYAYDLSGNVISEFAPTCSGGTVECLTVGYLYLGGAPIAEYKNSTTYFVHSDQLGSARLLTGVNQSIQQNLDYLPYGEITSGDTGITTHKFTGDERDSESSLDHTWFRQYSSSLGRWMHPDPAGLAAVDPTNPQSWNRYAYVMNNPMNSVDPLGLDDCHPEEACWAQGGNNFGGGLNGGENLCDITGCNNFWDGRSYVGIGGGSFGGYVNLSIFQAYSVETNVTTTETNIDGSFGSDFLTYSFVLPLPPGLGGNSGGSQAAADAAAQSCRENGHILSFKIPFTQIPVAIDASVTVGLIKYNSTNDLQTVIPLAPMGPPVGAGVGFTIKVGAPKVPAPQISYGIQNGLSAGFFINPVDGKHQGFVGSLGLAVGPVYTLVLPTNNVCGMVAKSGGG